MKCKFVVLKYTPLANPTFFGLISASSRVGLDGELKIDSPTVDLDAMLVVLPGAYVEQAQLKTCTTDDIENPSTFKINLSRDIVIPLSK
jgi:hypothetical protein